MELANRLSSSWNKTLRRRRLPTLGNDYEADSYPVLRLKGRRTELLELRNYAYSSLAGGVRTLIALHHGRKMKRESLASCRGRVNISGSKIAWINVECNGDSLSVAVPSKVFAVLRDSCYSSVTNLLLGGNWRDSERIETAALPKNLFIWQQLHSQPMAVWIISNSRVI